MKRKNLRLLQLFAQGGEGAAAGDAAAAATGETGADAGHQTLLELGVPADKLRKRATGTAAEQPLPNGQDAAAQPTQQKQHGRMTWEQVKADPEYSRHMQQMVKERLKNAKQAQEKLTQLEQQADLQGQQQQAQLRRHFAGLQQQARELQQRYPGFDLEKELQNPAFVRLTAPNVGISVEDAYYTVHRQELQRSVMQVTAQNTARQISNAIRAGVRRPEENGTVSHTPSVTVFDYRNASRDQREALKQQIRQAAARGEKIYPGNM